jgi:hypothetical protein
MSTIYTRAGKGSALTWTEGDANITNLNNDKIEDIVEDTTPQLGGNLDVNGNKIVSVSNGNIALEPNGTGKVTATSNIETTGDVKGKELYSTNSTGDEGGQINLALAATNTTLSSGVTIDVYQNKLRLYETGGSARGAYIDLTAAGTSVSSNLLGGGGASSLDGLSDVTITGTPSVGQILRYTGNNVFENVAAGYLAAVGGDSSPQLGGNLNVNGNAIVSASNGNIRIEPNGSGNIMITPSTGQIILGSTNYPTAMPTSGQVLTAGTGGALSWSTPTSGGIANVVEDTTPELGGNLNINGYNIVSTSGTEITIAPGNINNGIRLQSNNLYFGNPSATSGTAFLMTAGSQNLNLSANASITLGYQANANVDISPAGTGKVILSGMSFPAADGTSNQVLKTDGAGNLSWTTVSSGVTISDDTSTNATRYIVFDDSTSGSQTAFNVSSSKLTFNPSTGRLTSTEFAGSLRAYNEGAIYDLGTTGGTVAPNVANGNVQKITLNSALTLNAFTSPVAGQSLTLIIYGGTSYTSITSTMKFAGGIKTLTGTAGCIDILSVYYDGTNYFASLGKGFA